MDRKRCQLIQLLFFVLMISCVFSTYVNAFPNQFTAMQNVFPLNGEAFNEKQGKVEELGWRFNYTREPSVLSFVPEKEFGKMESFGFQIKSSRDGQVFLRMDQSDGRIFMTHFPVTTTYKAKKFTPDDFLIYGTDTGAKLNLSLVTSIYIVDLNGADENITGERTVFFKKLSQNAGLPRQMALIAYGKNGGLLGIKDFKNNGLSLGRWYGLWDLDGKPVESSVTESDVEIDGNNSGRVPVVKPEDNIDTLEIFFWSCGDKYKVRLKIKGLSGAKEGVGGQEKIFLNREFAVTRLEDISAYLKKRSMYAAYKPRIEKYEASLALPGNNESWSKKASGYDAALAGILDLSREIVISESEKKLDSLISFSRWVSLPLPVSMVSPFARLDQIEVELVDPAFRTGFGLSGFSPAGSGDNQKKYYSELRSAGFNHFVLPLFWDQIADSDNSYNPSDWEGKFFIDELVRLGYTLQAHGIIQNGMPESVRKKTGHDFKSIAVNHLKRTVSDYKNRYGDNIIIWESANEVASNELGGMRVRERCAMTSELTGELEKIVGDNLTMVNDYDCDRGEIFGNIDDPAITGSLDFYRRLVASGNNVPDVLGIEWYPGMRIEQPQFNVDLSEPCYDLFDSALYFDELIAIGKRIIISESNMPGAMSESDRNGYAWGKWTPQTQADAASDILRLCMVRPGIIGWIWWSLADNEPWNRAGGLYTDSGIRKPVFEAVKNVLSKIRIKSKSPINSSRQIKLPAMAGVYKISGKDVSFKIRQDENNRITLVDGSQP